MADTTVYGYVPVEWVADTTVYGCVPVEWAADNIREFALQEAVKSCSCREDNTHTEIVARAEAFYQFLLGPNPAPAKNNQAAQRNRTK